jgi:IS5 family transposase
MIRYESQNQLSIEEFRTPFELKLSRENRWIRLATALPWDALVNIYSRALSKKHGRPVVDPRIVIGALIIKHKEGLSDERTIEAIQENVYQRKLKNIFSPLERLHAA